MVPGRVDTVEVTSGTTRGVGIRGSGNLQPPPVPGAVRFSRPAPDADRRFVHRLLAGIALLGLVGLPACSAHDEDEEPLMLVNYPRLPNADAESEVKIAAVEAVCDKVARGKAMPAAALAFHGQILKWRVTVQKLQGRRLIAGVGSLTLSLELPAGTELDFRNRMKIEVVAQILNLDPGGRLLMLVEPTAMPLGR